MRLPAIIATTRTPIILSGRPAAGGAGPGGLVTPPFVMQHQEQSEWCWAAVAMSVSHFYSSRSTWTQCAIVNADRGRTDCCANGSSTDCNVAGYLDKALGTTGNLNSYVPGTLLESELDTEIRDNNPLGCRIGWTDKTGAFDGTGHFVVLHGYSQRAVAGAMVGWVEVADPLYYSSSMSYADFTTAYRHAGRWTDSYRTQS